MVAEVRFKNNGLDLIEVQDNGSGISPENYENVGMFLLLQILVASLIFGCSLALKHYTSKLSTYDDLTSLHTFGFRGEAISSLCALADFQIVTAQANQVPRANRLEFEQSGKLKKTQIVAGQKGTTASVDGIFKRLPVRRRELEKNIKREYGKVLNLLHAYASISTGVKFSVRNTVGKTKNVVVFSTNGNKTTKENIANVYGAKTLSALISLDLELEFEPAAATKRAGDDKMNKIQVRGHISRPVFGEGRQTPDRQMFFVNSRPCGLPQIGKAFNEVYKSFNVSQSPFIFADFQMDTNAYDVNVSPDKRQILLHDAGAMIESLKTSLTQLFEDADQTVPQSSVKNKPLAKQQALSSLPGFVTARELSQNSDNGSPARDQNRESSAEPSEASQQSAISRFKKSQEPMESPAQARPSPTRSLRTPRASANNDVSTPAASQLETPSVGIPDDDIPPQSSVDEDADSTPALHEPSSQLSALADTPSRARQASEETPNVVQNAFDRMRPRREPAELATITIGNRTITSMVGSGLPRKRAQEDPPFMKEPPRRKRRIHTPSRPNMFGDQMKAFAAPGSQVDAEAEDGSSSSDAEEAPEEDQSVAMDDDEEETEEEQEQEEHEDEDEAEEAEEEVDELEDEEHHGSDGSHASKDIDPSLEKEGPQQGTQGFECDAGLEDDHQDDNLDESKKKAQEEATVQRLIHEAEETALLPEENNAKRANKMNKGAAHRDATVQLVSTADGSISRLQSQHALLQRTLRERTTRTAAEISEDGERTAEDKLSLTVTKKDFAEMRIIGQFNLGFIIAVRPGEGHDELFIIDQHASDEKYNFERLQAETVVQNQRLVRPQRLDLTAVEEEVVLENREALEKNGFLVTIDESGDEPIGRRCQLVSLPLSKEVVFGVRDLEELIVLLSESVSMNEQSVPRPGKVRKMFAMRACRSSIMIGKTLTTRQMQRVVQNMGTIDKPWNCPHGRPTMRHLMSLGHWDEYDEYENEGLDPWRNYLGGDEDE